MHGVRLSIWGWIQFWGFGESPVRECPIIGDDELARVRVPKSHPTVCSTRQQVATVMGVEQAVDTAAVRHRRAQHVDLLRSNRGVSLLRVEDFRVEG
jgi:hypothetical protein